MVSNVAILNSTVYSAQHGVQSHTPYDTPNPTQPPTYFFLRPPLCSILRRIPTRTSSSIPVDTRERLSRHARTCFAVRASSSEAISCRVPSCSHSNDRRSCHTTQHITTKERQTRTVQLVSYCCLSVVYRTVKRVPLYRVQQ